MSQLVGDYALGALLGHGGASAVYAARHVPTGAAVAIKLLRDGDAGAALAAALAEAAGPRAIDHPAVVRVLDVGHDAATGQCYLVMEHLAGETLAARLARSGPLDEASARRLGATIADGMAAVHARGIVHRDLKPANVIVRGDAPTIVDFGIAKHLGDRAVATTARRIGTPPYMAPEQFTGGVITPAVDVFALGVMLFELVTGELPFAGYEDGRCPQLFDAPRRLGGRGSAELDALIARCLAREPGQRPRAMADVARALRGAAPIAGDVADERVTEDAGPVLPAAPSVAAMPAGPVRRAARWPWAAAAVIAGAALIGVVVAVATDGGAAKATAKTPATMTEGSGDGNGDGDGVADGDGDGIGNGIGDGIGIGDGNAIGDRNAIGDGNGVRDARGSGAASAGNPPAVDEPAAAPTKRRPRKPARPPVGEGLD